MRQRRWRCNWRTAQRQPATVWLRTRRLTSFIESPAAFLQAPPNLTPLEEGASTDGGDGLEASWSALLAAGINDWGGVSPLTRDWVNPEKPWPHVHALAGVTARAGFPLLPRYTLEPLHPLVPLGARQIAFHGVHRIHSGDSPAVQWSGSAIVF